MNPKEHKYLRGKGILHIKSARWIVTYVKNFTFKKFMVEKQLLDINISVTDLIYNLPIIAFVW